jgi:TCP-1/cpn60 chaperonin family
VPSRRCFQGGSKLRSTLCSIGGTLVAAQRHQCAAPQHTCSTCSSLSSKVVSQYSAVFAPMAVDAVLKVLDPKYPQLLDIKNIKIVSKVGSTIDESELVDGMVFDQKASKAAGGPTRVEKAKIGLIQVRSSQPVHGCAARVAVITVRVLRSRTATAHATRSASSCRHASHLTQSSLAGYQTHAPCAHSRSVHANVSVCSSA